MSSEITAEGGTITLSTAPDGEITASSADFAVYVVQQVEGGGSGVTEYATLAELITASEGSLAEGYYTVTETPPVTHPLYPKIVTYWDGTDFEPQISTGFEAHPTYPERTPFVWDSLEHAFRDRTYREGAEFFHLQPTDGWIIPYGTASVSGSVNPVLANKRLQRNGFFNQTWLSFGFPEPWKDEASSHANTLIFVGVATNANASSSVNTVLQVGTNSSRQALGLHNRQGSTLTWAITDRSEVWDTTVAPRAEGDVVIVTSDGSVGYAVWVNGAKYSYTAAGSASGTGTTRNLQIGNAAGTEISRPECAFILGANREMDDTAAAAWTAWLQTRYGIPTL
jgi:hypothetical protein